MRRSWPVSSRRSVVGAPEPPEMALRRGFTLIELMVVVGIITILIGMLLGGIWLARRALLKNEAKHTLEMLKTGIINMRRNYEYDTVLGAYTSGKTIVGTPKFQDPYRDFAAAGITAGQDKLYVLGGRSAGEYTIAAVAATELTVSSNFAFGEPNLDYYVGKPDGTSWPKVELAKELDPMNPDWMVGFVPHLNSRKTRYYIAKPGRTKNVGGGKQLTDPWGTPYTYRIERQDLDKNGKVETILEKVICAGEDRTLDTKDDYSTEVYRTRVGG